MCSLGFICTRGYLKKKRKRLWIVGQLVKPLGSLYTTSEFLTVLCLSAQKSSEEMQMTFEVTPRLRPPPLWHQAFRIVPEPLV